MATITLEIPDNLAKAIREAGDQLPLILEMGMSRLAPLSTQAYREALGLLTQDASAEAIAEFRFSDEIEERIHILLEKNKSDQLNRAEQVELERLVELEDQLQLLKATALASKN